MPLWLLCVCRRAEVFRDVTCSRPRERQLTVHMRSGEIFSNWKDGKHLVTRTRVELAHKSNVHSHHRVHHFADACQMLPQACVSM